MTYQDTAFFRDCVAFYHAKTRVPSHQKALAMQAVSRLVAMGCALHWLRPQSKAPIAADWAALPVATQADLERTWHPGHGLGVRCGQWSTPRPGHGLIILDIDAKHCPYAHAEPFEFLGRFAWPDGFPQVLSGSILGQHWWFACPLDRLPPQANTLLAKSPREVTPGLPEWSIEVLSTGKQVAIPPTCHPETGLAYQWMTPIEGEIPLLPQSILNALPQEPLQRTPPARQASISRTGPSVADAFRAVAWAEILEPHGWRYVRTHGEHDYWVRPGKEGREGISASTVGDVFYCFSTSTGFDAQMGYTKFSVYALLNHAGNQSAAAKALATMRETR